MQSSDNIPPLLRLPIELRRLIYTLVLPHTTTFDVRSQRSLSPPAPTSRSLTLVRQANGSESWKVLRIQPYADRSTGNDIVWRRGCTSLLAVNRQLHEETADMLYGDNIFVLDVTFDAVEFRYRWRTANNLTPSRSYAFLEHFSQRNLMRVRRYVVNVESVDDYMGMIKYNCGGRGLPAGIRAKVQELVELLAVVPVILRLDVHLIDGTISRVRFPSGRVHRVQDDANYAQTQRVLDPFGMLCSVRKANFTGVGDEYAADMEKRVTARKIALQA
jgi:hypothetical protein